MASEVRTLGDWADHSGICVGVSGARPDRAEELARQMISESDVELLISWGIAGGLDPALSSGDVLVPREVVVASGERYPLAAELLPGSDDVTIFGAEDVVATVSAKAELCGRTGTVAVDMETHRVAIATNGRIPCLAVRAVSDPAERALPALAAGALDPEGNPRVAHLIGGLARRPWEFPGLLAAKRDSDTALTGLRDRTDHVLARLLSR